MTGFAFGDIVFLMLNALGCILKQWLTYQEEDMSMKTFLFGRPSRWHEIESAWKQSVAEERERYNKKIFLIEKCIMDEIGFPSENAPKSIDEKLHRLDSMNMQIGSLLDDLGLVEDRLFFDMLEKRKQDEMASASLLRRIWLWMYWHM